MSILVKPFEDYSMLLVTLVLQVVQEIRLVKSVVHVQPNILVKEYVNYNFCTIVSPNLSDENRVKRIKCLSLYIEEIVKYFNKILKSIK